MDFLSLTLAAFGLSADCFAIAVSGSASLRTVTARQVFRTSFAFGLFQFSMPLLGWLAGRTLVDTISAYDHWVAFAILAIVGGKAIRESLRPPGQEPEHTDFTRGFALVTLSVATSLDALAVGLSLALLKVNIMSASFVIGLVAFGVTASGFAIGQRAGRLFGKRAKLAGGCVLLGIGLRILIGGLVS